MYIKRERYLAKIRSFYEVDLIKVLTGVRRCGQIRFAHSDRRRDPRAKRSARPHHPHQF